MVSVSLQEPIYPAPDGQDYEKKTYENQLANDHKLPSTNHAIADFNA
jgi:hypothetical protein